MSLHVDPVVAELTAMAAKPLVERGIRKLTEKAAETENKLSDDFEIISKEMTILCPEKVQKYSAILDVRRNRLFKKRLEFRHGVVRRCSIHPISSLSKVEGAIVLNDAGFTIDLRKLDEGEKYALDVEYELEDEKFIDSLVERSRPKETPSSSENRYWMVAALKHLDVLKSDYGRIDLYDLDFNVNVGISQDLDTKVPKIFKQQLEQLVKIAGPLGRDELFKAFYNLRTMKKRKYGDNSLKLLGELQELFLPSKFSDFVEVRDDFHYGNCERGVNEFEVSLSWPRTMKVVSRTDLSLEKPMSKGTLIYKKSLFFDEVGKIVT